MDHQPTIDLSPECHDCKHAHKKHTHTHTKYWDSKRAGKPALFSSMSTRAVCLGSSCIPDAISSYFMLRPILQVFNINILYIVLYLSAGQKYHPPYPLPINEPALSGLSQGHLHGTRVTSTDDGMAALNDRCAACSFSTGRNFYVCIWQVIERVLGFLGTPWHMPMNKAMYSVLNLVHETCQVVHF